MPANPQVLLETPRFRVVEHDPATGASARKRHVIEHPGAAIILPLLEGSSHSEPRVVLIRNHRLAVGKTLIELPAGTLEPPEPPLDTARRELAEETGYSAEQWTELPGFFMSPGILKERMHAFVARRLTPGAPNREEGEEIENLVLPWEQALEMVKRGEIEDAKTVATLLYCHCFVDGMTKTE